ncbi:MAG: hypothetical protein DBX59_03505 [Bacillota bacterium]|nr:MAG: hypothetical protein DBX59_03505 [Bacillota bacterium]
MKKAWKLLCALLAAVLAFGLVACNPEKGPDDGGNGGNETKIEIAGTYSIDLSAMEMPLTIYLKVEENGDFKFSNTKTFEMEKSSGTISKTSTDYLMLYKKVNGNDVTGKTCNLTKETNGNLKFVGTILYASVTIPSPMQNEDTGDDVYFFGVPVTGDEGGESGNTLEIGLYKWSDEKNQYYLNLLEGGSFTAFVYYTGMASGYAYDYGTYTKMGAMCRMTSSVYKDAEDKTKPLTESVTVDTEGVIKADVKLTPFAKATKEITLTAVTEKVDVALTYEGTKVMPPMMGNATYNLELTILSDGSYTFTSTNVSGEGEPYTETGFIGLENNMSGKGVIIPQGVTTAGEITIGEDESITFKVPVVTGTPRGSVTLAPKAAA